MLADLRAAGWRVSIHTAQSPVFLATVEDLFSRRLLGFALSDRHPTADLAQAAVNMAVAVRGGDVAGWVSFLCGCGGFAVCGVGLT